MGLLENADQALDIAIAVYVRGLQTGPVLVENQPFRIRQIIGLPMVEARPTRAAISSSTRRVWSILRRGCRCVHFATSDERAANYYAAAVGGTRNEAR